MASNSPSTARGSSGDREPFAAFVTDDDSVKLLSPIATEFGWSPERIQAGGVASAVRALTVMTSPEFLIVDLSDSADKRGDINALAEVCEPGTVVLAIGKENDVTLYRDLVRSGIQDYLVKPLQSDILRDAINSAQAALQEPQAAAEGQATAHRYAAIIGVRGGVGASTLVTCCGWIAAHESNRNVALLDLDIYFGTTALTFDLEPGRGLCDALESPNRVDGLFIERATIKESDNLSILGAENPISEPLTPDSAALGHLLNEVRQGFEIVVADIPRHIIANYPYIFTDIDMIILVSDLSLAGTRDTIRILAFLQDVAPAAQIKVVVNMVGTGMNNEVTQKDFEASIERKIDWAIPADPKSFIGASKKGKSLPAVSPNSRPARMMREISALIAGIKTKDSKAPRWGKLGSLGKK